MVNVKLNEKLSDKTLICVTKNKNSPKKIIFNVISDSNLDKKSIKELMFGTRNKTVVLFSKIFGIKKTNEIMEKCLSNNQIICKILDAEKHGFEILFNVEDNEVAHEKEGPSLLLREGKEGWAVLIKSINDPNMIAWEYDDKYWNNVKNKLLNLYDQETTEAILEHYNYNFPSKKDRIVFIAINGISKDKEDAPNEGIYIEAHLNSILEDSKIERKTNNKTVIYNVNIEDVLSVFIDSLIEIFG